MVKRKFAHKHGLTIQKKSDKTYRGFCSCGWNHNDISYDLMRENYREHMRQVRKDKLKAELGR